MNVIADIAMWTLVAFGVIYVLMWIAVGWLSLLSRHYRRSAERSERELRERIGDRMITALDNDVELVRDLITMLEDPTCTGISLERLREHQQGSQLRVIEGGAS